HHDAPYAGLVRLWCCPGAVLANLAFAALPCPRLRGFAVSGIIDSPRPTEPPGPDSAPMGATVTTPPGTNPQSQEPGGERRGDGEVPLQHGQTSQFGQPGAGAYGKREAAGTHGSPVLFRPMQVTIAAALAWLGSVLMILF